MQKQFDAIFESEISVTSTVDILANSYTCKQYLWELLYQNLFLSSREVVINLNVPEQTMLMYIKQITKSLE